MESESSDYGEDYAEPIQKIIHGVGAVKDKKEKEIKKMLESREIARHEKLEQSRGNIGTLEGVIKRLDDFDSVWLQDYIQQHEAFIVGVETFQKLDGSSELKEVVETMRSMLEQITQHLQQKQVQQVEPTSPVPPKAKVKEKKPKKSQQDLPAYVLVHPGRLQQQLAAGQGVQVFAGTEPLSTKILPKGYVHAEPRAQAAVHVVNNSQTKGMKLNQLRQAGWQIAQVSYSERETVTLSRQELVQQARSVKMPERFIFTDDNFSKALDGHVKEITLASIEQQLEQLAKDNTPYKPSLLVQFGITSIGAQGARSRAAYAAVQTMQEYVKVLKEGGEPGALRNYMVAGKSAVGQDPKLQAAYNAIESYAKLQMPEHFQHRSELRSVLRG